MRRVPSMSRNAPRMASDQIGWFLTSLSQKSYLSQMTEFIIPKFYQIMSLFGVDIVTEKKS